MRTRPHDLFDLRGDWQHMRVLTLRAFPFWRDRPKLLLQVEVLQPCKGNLALPLSREDEQAIGGAGRPTEVFGCPPNRAKFVRLQYSAPHLLLAGGFAPAHGDAANIFSATAHANILRIAASVLLAAIFAPRAYMPLIRSMTSAPVTLLIGRCCHLLITSPFVRVRRSPPSFSDLALGPIASGFTPRTLSGMFFGVDLNKGKTQLLDASLLIAPCTLCFCFATNFRLRVLP